MIYLNYLKYFLVLFFTVTNAYAATRDFDDREPTTVAHRSKKQSLMDMNPTGRRYQVWLDSPYEWICPRCDHWSRAHFTNLFKATNRERIFLNPPPSYVCYECVKTIKPEHDKSIWVIKYDHK